MACQVHAENWAALGAFLACDTQWRTAGTMAGIRWIGLDYVAVKVVLDADGQKLDVLADLQVMERAALPVLNERRPS